MLNFMRVNPDDPSHIQTLLRWDNDPILSKTLRPNFHNQPLPKVTYEQVEQSMRQADRICYLFSEKEEEWLGYVSLQIAHPVIMRQREQSGWLGICIGEAAGRGKGYGKLAMDYIEIKAIELGLSRIELGYFEFNLPARRLYDRCGYHCFAKEENFAWHNGVMFADIRMEKNL